ncbi:hypothetical protein [Mammaliicoccus sciuri]|uniref:hypothetical protein n=1 Tax=Mammaliicoccus sciuri TaxID=1296 RepID=UPI003A9445F0
MKVYLISLTVTMVILALYIKWNYKVSQIQDNIDQPPIDFEETKGYKENIAWFKGLGRD